MKTATGLTMLAVGAILAFAVSASPPGLNLNIAGWVIMLTGAAGILLPSRASGWLRRHVLVRKSPGVPAADETGATGEIDPTGATGGIAYPEYVLRDPAAVASAILRDAELAGTADDDLQTVADLTAGDPADDWADPAPVSIEELLEGRAGPGSRPK
jgi:hypothetical protein